MSKRLFKVFAGLVGGLALVACLDTDRSVGAEASVTIRLMADKTYQTMTGWEATARLWEMDKDEDRFDASWERYDDLIFDHLVNELGINRLRIEIKSGAENPVDYARQFYSGDIGYRDFRRHFYEKINDNDDPAVSNPGGFHFTELDYQVEKILMPIKERLEARGEKLFVNLCYVDFRWTPLKGTFEHALNADEYAELIEQTFHHLKSKYDLVPDALEIVLEPDNTDRWRGREVGEAAVAALARLRTGGYSPKVIAPSTSVALRGVKYFDDMMRVKGMRDILGTYAYHRYDVRFADTALPRIRKRAKKFRLDTAMLEYTRGNAAQLYNDLTVANVSAWQQYAIATNTTEETGGKISYYYVVNVADPDNPKIRMNRNTPGLAQYFRYVRLGAVRYKAKSSSGSFHPVAFVNPDGRHVVIVTAEQSGSLSIEGLPAGRYGARALFGDNTFHDLKTTALTTGEALTLLMPERGILTIYQQAE